jgi:hypothetical protein
LALVLVPAALVAFASCSSPPNGPAKVETYEEVAGGSGFGGETVVNSTTTNATIVSLDSFLHKIGLKYPDGTRVIYKAGPEIADFNRFKLGDQLQTTVTESFSISLAGKGPLPDPAKGDTIVQAPKGLELGVKPVATVKFTAKVLALDYVQRQVRLMLPDGQSRTVQVREAVNLGDVNVGDNVSVLITKSMTIVPERP